MKIWCSQGKSNVTNFYTVLVTVIASRPYRPVLHTFPLNSLAYWWFTFEVIQCPALWIFFLIWLQGHADLEVRNNRQQTPLLLAVSQGHTALIELLVSQGARVNVADEDGDTCLHLALMRQTVASERESSPMLDAVSCTNPFSFFLL